MLVVSRLILDEWFLSLCIYNIYTTNLIGGSGQDRGFGLQFSETLGVQAGAVGGADRGDLCWGPCTPMHGDDAHRCDLPERFQQRG